MFKSCNCKSSCTLLAVIASIIIGFVTVLLGITSVITVTPAFLWVVFGIAVVYLGIAFLKADSFRRASFEECGCPALNALLTGILGSVLTSVILLAIEFAATSIIGAIITGALLFFFTLTLTSTACLIKCAANCDD